MSSLLIELGVLSLLGAGQCATIVALRRAQRHKNHLEQQLADSECRRKEIQSLARVGDWEYDLRDDQIHWSDETFRIFGIPPGTHEPDFADVLLGIHPEDAPLFDRAMQQAVSAGASYDLDIRIRCSDGREKYIHAQGSPVMGDNSQTERIIGTVLDITERKRAERELLHEATHDALTGLFSRRSLLASLETAIVAAGKSHTSLSLCICDLDRFKSVNDTYGHATGDDLLVIFSQLLRDGTRAADVTGRLGGDEFCILLPQCNGAQAATCMERIRVRFCGQEFGATQGQTYTSSATFGISQFQPSMSAKDLLESADQALYQAKEQGRNCVVTSSHIHQRPPDSFTPEPKKLTQKRSCVTVIFTGEVCRRRRLKFVPFSNHTT